MKLNDVIDIDGKLYKITYLGMSGNFEAKPIGKAIKCSVMKEPQLIEELNAFCDDKLSCWGCPLARYSNCFFDEYTSKQLNEAYNIIKENDYESID